MRRPPWDVASPGTPWRQRPSLELSRGPLAPRELPRRPPPPWGLLGSSHEAVAFLGAGAPQEVAATLGTPPRCGGLFGSYQGSESSWEGGGLGAGGLLVSSRGGGGLHGSSHFLLGALREAAASLGAHKEAAASVGAPTKAAASFGAHQEAAASLGGVYGFS